MSNTPQNCNKNVALTDEQRKLAEENMKLVPAIARRYLGHDIPFEDLCGYGYLALCIAARSYKGINDATFATFATPYIEGHLTDIVHRYDYEKYFLNQLTQSDLETRNCPLDEYMESEFEKIIEPLTEEERNVVKSLTGIGERKKTCTELAMEMGKERHTVANILKQAIEKIKPPKY